ncbi:MAG: xylose isomerase protein [Paenibacillus sp.]|nr:xylose isomerase protein [Paenibacillus sp.]
MKIGLSTFALAKAIRSGQLSVVEAIQWTADNGGDFVEIVPVGFDLEQEPGLIEPMRAKAAEAGIELAHYCIGASFVGKSDQEWQDEVDRVKRHVDIVHQLGMKAMRHDAASRPLAQCGLDYFEADLPAIVEASRIIADYAAGYGITTSIENHGLYVEASERVRRVIRLVDRPNFKTTIDIGNFLFAGEDPLSAVQKNLPVASMVHLKDFFVRPPGFNAGEGFKPLPNGSTFRSTIFGHGDLNVRQMMRAIKHSDFNGLLSLEFNGIEDCLLASRIGLANAKRIWDEA